MKKKLNCEQISALISFYLDGTLSPTLAKYVQKHIENCTDCQYKYCKEIFGTSDNLQEINENTYLTKQYEVFKKNLSSYIDNELNASESVKIKKIAISNPKARKDLEEIYAFKKLLNNAYEKTKSELKTDYSKITMTQIKHQKNNLTFYKIAALFLITITSIAGLMKILYF